MLNMAFKEWAAVCRALEDGTQTVIVRKGGIAESGGRFQPDHSRFWLYPTHFHEQQQTGLKPGADHFLEAAERGKSPPGTVTLANVVEVADVSFVDRLDVALRLDAWHIWSPETIEQRFHYRTPGLYVLAVRVWKTAEQTVPELPAYAGCKTWVELERALPDDGKPVLSDADADARFKAIRERLNQSR